MNAEEYKSGACNCEKHSSCQYCKFELCLILPIVAIVGAISVFVLLACNNLVVHSGDSHVTYYYSAPIDVSVDKMSGNWLSVPDSCSNSTSLFLRQIGVPADMTKAVMATKMEITITFQFNPQVGSVTLIKASPDNRELFEESRDVSKTILLHNNRWTENKVMQKTYFLNFTGDNEFMLKSKETDSNDHIDSHYEVEDNQLKIVREFNNTVSICYYKRQ